MSTAFLERLEKAGLFGSAELEEIRQLAAEFPDPKALGAELVRRGRLTRWQAGQLVLGRNVVLGKYVLIDVLSPDEVNPLFLARHRAMERHLVLRVLAKQLSQLEEWRNRFLAEAQLWAALDHPRLVRAYNAEQDAGRYFLVLEFIEGDSLEQLVRDSGVLPPEAIFQLAYEAAEGLQVLHAREIAHGNLRPSKLMITHDGSVKLLDRGFSHWIREACPEKLSAGTKNVEGRWEWQAPEVRTGAGPSIQADLFSLGACLFYSATGRGLPPCGPDTTPAAWREQCSEQLEDQPMEVREFLLDLLAWDPAERLQNAEELLRRLEPVVIQEKAAEAPAVPASSAETEVGLEVGTATHGSEVEGGEAETIGVMAQAEVVGVEAKETSGIQVGETVGEEQLESRAESLVGTGGEEAQIFPVEVPARTTSLLGRSSKKPSVFQGWKTRWGALSKRQKILAVGGGLVTLTLLVVVLGGVAWLLRSGGQRSAAVLARTGQERPSTSAGSREDQTSTEIRFPEIKPDLTFDPTKFDAPAGDQKSGASPGQPLVPIAVPEQQTSSLEDSETPASASSGESSGPRSPASPEVSPSPEEMAAESQPAQEESEAKPPAEETTGVTPPSEDQMGGENPPEPAEEVRPQGKEPPEKLFEGFPEIVELPEFAAPKEGEELLPVEIGRVGGDPNASWQLILLGGTQAFRKGVQFVLHEISIPGEPPNWLVQLESTGVGGKSQVVPVGKFTREGGRLYFQWDANAPYPTANYLRNCVLQIRVGSENRYVRLRQPAAVEVPPIELTRGVVNIAVTAKWLPAEEFLAWELVGIDGVKVTPEVEPKLPAPPRGVFMVYVPRKDRDGNTHRAVPIRLTFSSRSQGFGIRVQVLAEKTPLRSIPPDLGNRNIFRSSLEQKRRELEKKLNPPDKKEPPKGLERSQLLQQLRAIEELLWYCQFMDEADGKARLHFRIFSEVAGQKLVFAEG